jgi:hypothetical protein
MFSVRKTAACLVLLYLSISFVYPTAHGKEKKDSPRNVVGDLKSVKIPLSSKHLFADESYVNEEPTAVNWWKATQVGDTKKAARIRAILDEQAQKTYHSRSDGIVPDPYRPVPPHRGDEFYKQFIWGNDLTITDGSVSNGISIDSDGSGNMYAVRCTTYLDSANAGVRIYKSTDGGASWFVLNGFGAANGAFSFSYPTVLTGSSGNKLYVFYLRSDQNGKIGLARFLQSGFFEDYFDIKADNDTITYFSVCGDYGGGDTLMLAYQRELNYHQMYTLRSTDYGETWGGQSYVDDYSAHPNIAYGRNGFVYLVWEKETSSDSEIRFFRNSNYCSAGGWEELDYLTEDTFDDRYPKVAALHTLPHDGAGVWTAYNCEVKRRDYLMYDDDTATYFFTIPDTYGDDFFNVRFTAPAWDVKLLYAEFYFYYKIGTGPVRFYVWDSDGTYPTTKIDSVDIQDGDFPPLPNWVPVDFSSKNIIVNTLDDFHIGFHPLGPPSTDTLAIISDNGEPEAGHRSCEYWNGVWGTMFDDWGTDFNFMIRAEVEEEVSRNKDLHFAYSTNSGADWSKNHVLAESQDYDEMACDLWTKRDESSSEVHLSYLKFRLWIREEESYICHGYSSTSGPTNWHSPNPINEHLGAWDEDGRKVSQGTFSGLNRGILYAGKSMFPWNFEGLYFDNSSWVGVEEERGWEVEPMGFTLSANYPNPFNPETSIDYYIPSACHVRLDIFNVLGQHVRTLVDEDQAAGEKTVAWDSRNQRGESVTSGIYLYRLEAGEFIQSNKMVLIR